jgi:mono/diheme cytochrome c family protein
MNIKKSHFLALGLLTCGTAYAFPWDIDLVDAKFLRGYEWRMMTPAEGSISQEQSSPLTGVTYKFMSDMTGLQKGQNVVSAKTEDAPNFIRLPDQAMLTEQASVYEVGKSEAKAYYASIQNKEKLGGEAYMLKKGEELAKTYCKACHVVEIGAEKSPVTWGNEFNSRGNPVQRWALPGGIKLAGADSTLTVNARHKDSDAPLYDVIRNGWGQMPAYGHAMYDHEIWATISYLRSVSK